ncbi:T-lymphocyte surface antigen Ly-9-like [Morphnus guianensis]
MREEELKTACQTAQATPGATKGWLKAHNARGFEPQIPRDGQSRAVPGPLECWEQAVSANGALHLQPDKPPQEWTKVTWRVRLDAGYQQRILTVEKYKADLFSNSTFFGRAVFQQETFSLRISPVSTADSGVYEAEFEDTSGTLTTRCFRVSVWEPVHSLHLETHILDWEQGWCNLSLVCTVSGAGNVSYSWSCSGDPRGALEHQPWLHLQVHGDADPTVCRCNVSNPVSWSTDSTNITAASCQAVASGLCLCCDIKLLKGLKGQSLSFPALHPFFADITQVTWRSQGTHITEAKPKEKRLTIDYVPRLRGQLFIHPTNLSLEIRPPKLGDNGKYEVVVDTLSDPTKPKTFSYSLRVHGKSKDGGRRVVGTRLGFSPPWACPHEGGLPLCKAPSPEPTHPMTSPP